jgi:hypothetical protein
VPDCALARAVEDKLTATPKGWQPSNPLWDFKRFFFFFREGWGLHPDALPLLKRQGFINQAILAKEDVEGFQSEYGQICNCCCEGAQLAARS